MYCVFVFTFAFTLSPSLSFTKDTVYCVDYDVHVPLSTLVPDLLMTDLPPNLIIDQSCFEFNPKDLSTRLGRGGAGNEEREGERERERIGVIAYLTKYNFYLLIMLFRCCL